MVQEHPSSLEPSILVTGGTGTLGQHVVARLSSTHDIRVLSRDDHDNVEGVTYAKGDLSTGHGIDDAVDRIEIVIHCAGSAKGDHIKATSLTEAASRSGVKHIVYISVVGADEIPITSFVDRMMFGYYEAKLAAEQAIAGSGVPWTTLRATQFHDLILTTASGMAKLPIIPVPAGYRFQPIDVEQVASRLVQLALKPPAGRVPDLGGPTVYSMEDLVRSYLEASLKSRPIVRVRLPGKAAEAFREGANLTPNQSLEGKSWQAFLADHFDRSEAPESETR